MADASQPPAQRWATVARLGKTRGLRGEIYGDGWNRPELCAELQRVWFRQPGGEFLFGGEPVGLLSVRPYKGRLVFLFDGLETIEAAEPLEGCEVVIPRGDRPALESGEYFLSDLVGCAVVDRATGKHLGRVTGWQETGGPIVLEMLPEGAGPEGAVLIPFARSICVEIDPAAGRIGVDLPEGLIELNQARPAGPERPGR